MFFLYAQIKKKTYLQKMVILEGWDRITDCSLMLLEGKFLLCN